MFDQLKTLGAVAALLKDKDRLKEAGERIQRKLELMSITGAAGGGAVRVTIDGKLRVKSVHLDPAFASGLAAGDQSRVMGEALIAEAISDALGRAQEMIRAEAEREARELGLPAMPGLDKFLS